MIKPRKYEIYAEKIMVSKKVKKNIYNDLTGE